ncbi:MAG: response regulator transcription factor [Verrucomicrobia bacterium]|nr:response regulator transcription factor [Verrucomicrobiota bacterium]
MGSPVVPNARIVLVDDHPIIRKGLAQLINQQGGLQVCGEAANVEDALATVARLNPDLVIVDLTLGQANGLELIRRLRERRAEMSVLVLSMHDEELYALPALRAGANGYVMKQDAVFQIFTAIKEVLAGRTYLSEKMKKRTFDPDAR